MSKEGKFLKSCMECYRAEKWLFDDCIRIRVA